MEVFVGYKRYRYSFARDEGLRCRNVVLLQSTVLRETLDNITYIYSHSHEPLPCHRNRKHMNADFRETLLQEQLDLAVMFTTRPTSGIKHEPVISQHLSALLTTGFTERCECCPSMCVFLAHCHILLWSHNQQCMYVLIVLMYVCTNCTNVCMYANYIDLYCVHSN